MVYGNVFDFSDWVMAPNVYGMGLLVMVEFLQQTIYLWIKLFSQMMDFKKETGNVMDGLY